MTKLTQEETEEKYIDEVFDEWVNGMDTTENRINHLFGQKKFHVAFGAYLLTEQKDYLLKKARQMFKEAEEVEKKYQHSERLIGISIGIDRIVKLIERD